MDPDSWALGLVDTTQEFEKCWLRFRWPKNRNAVLRLSEKTETIKIRQRFQRKTAKYCFPGKISNVGTGKTNTVFFKFRTQPTSKFRHKFI